MQPQFLPMLAAGLALLAASCALYRVVSLREELRRDPSGAVSLRAATLAYREMDSGAVMMMEFDALPVAEGGVDEDRYLAQARRAIQTELRDTDVIGRRGRGFVLLLPGMPLRNASMKLMRIRARLDGLRPRAARSRWGLSHTDQADPWGSAADQLREPSFPDHFPPPASPCGVPLQIAVEVAGPCRTNVASVMVHGA